MICKIYGNEVPKEEKLWRYMNFSKFVSLIINKSIFFTRASEFKDEFEVTPRKLLADAICVKNEADELIKTDNKKKQKKGLIIKDKISGIYDRILKFKYSYIISCWHIDYDYSDAMWKVYCPNNDGIAIETTVEALLKTLEKIDSNEFIECGKVKYLKEDQYKEDGSEEILFSKRSYFKYENEFRMAIINENFEKYPYGKNIGEIDLNELIKSIHIAPEAPLWIKDLVEKILENANIKKPVIQKDIYKIRR